jgi:hypothetical protein
MERGRTCTAMLAATGTLLLLLPLTVGATARAQDAALPGAVAMTPQQLEMVLRARGYTGIEGMAPAGGGDSRLRIDRAERFGAPVGPLEVDAVSGQVRDEPPLTEAQARSLLRSRGFAEVPEVRREGDVILVRAMREGQEVALRIDARTGAVRPRGD